MDQHRHAPSHRLDGQGAGATGATQDLGAAIARGVFDQSLPVPA